MKQLLEFMDNYQLCVISTVGSDLRPESAIVGFSHTEQATLVIGTSQKSRKYANILHNPHVAAVIGDEKGEVQFEGTAQVISSDDYDKLIERSNAKKLPGADAYRKDPNQKYIKITPTWIRFITHGETNSFKEFTEFSA